MDDLVSAIKDVQRADPMIYPRLLEQHRVEEREAELDDWLTMWHVAERAKPVYKVHDAETGETVMPEAAPAHDDRLTGWDWFGLVSTMAIMAYVIVRIFISEV